MSIFDNDPDACEAGDVEPRPYADHAADAADRGYDPLPLPPRAKTPPPKGYTGARGASPTASQIVAWCAGKGDGNLALRLPRNVVGVDVDHYGDKRGADTLAALVAELGELPPTWRITSRGADSRAGIWLYRLPEPITLADDFGPAIDAIQYHHRYAVAPGSIHPEGRRYECFDAHGEDAELPYTDELPELPAAWRERFTVAHHAAEDDATPEDVARFTAEHDKWSHGETRGRAMLAAVADTVAAGNRHGSTVRALCWAAREAAADVYPWTEARTAIRARFLTLTAGDRVREFDKAEAFAIGQVTADDVAAVRDRLGDTDDPPDHATAPPAAELSAHALPAEFWNAHARLGAVRDAAYARGRAPAAVLGAALTRLCARLPHEIHLPGIVGARGSMNTAVALVGPSGSGKSTGDAVAGDLLTFSDELPDAPTMPPGSGEGVAELFLGTRDADDDEKARGAGKTVKTQVRWNMRLMADEGQGLMAQGGRNGATILPALRTALTGGQLGQANASVETFRNVPKHCYRLGALLLFQVATAVPLVDDTEGGTPQRFVFCAAVDATIPAPGERPDWPGTLHIDPPHGRSAVVTVQPEPAHEVAMADWERQRGEGDPRDSHAMLTRLKVAALLAWLCTGHLIVGSYQGLDTWALAGMVLDHSRAVLDHVTAHKAAAQHDEARRRTGAAVAAVLATEDATERRALEACVRSAGRVIRRHADRGEHNGEGCTRRCVAQAMAGKYRQLVTTDDVTSELLARGAAERDGDKYRPGPS